MNSVGIDLHHNARMSRCLETTPRDYSRRIADEPRTFVELFG
jgi:hypothetical protein